MAESQRRIKVIIADDEELIRAHLKRRIEKFGSPFQVVDTASDGKELLQQVNTHAPDVVFTDILMPLIDGLAAAKKIHEGFPHIRVVIISGYDDFCYAQEAIKQQVVSYLLKPVRSIELTELLQSLALDLAKEWETLLNMEGSMSPEQLCSLLKAYIHDHYKEPLSFNKLSSDLHYSPAYITKLFRQYVGVAPIRYLTDLRINQAIYMLEKSQISVSQVGQDVGYPNQYYFSRVFKQKTGMSPVEYRAAHAELSLGPKETDV